MTARGLCLWSSDGEGTCFADKRWFFSPCPQFSPKLIRPRWLAAPELFLASGRCDTAHVRVRERACCFSGETAAERENFTPTERERQVSVWKGEHVCHCMCAFVWAYKTDRERESCISPWEIKPGHNIHHRKTLISPFDKKGIESLFWSQPHTEKTAGECHTWVSPHRFRSVCPLTNSVIAIISFHLQSNRYSIHITNLCSWLNF